MQQRQEWDREMIVWLPAEGFEISGCRLRGVSEGFGFSLELRDGSPDAEKVDSGFQVQGFWLQVIQGSRKSL